MTDDDTIKNRPGYTITMPTWRQHVVVSFRISFCSFCQHGDSTWLFHCRISFCSFCQHGDSTWLFHCLISFCSFCQHGDSTWLFHCRIAFCSRFQPERVLNSCIEKQAGCHGCYTQLRVGRFGPVCPGRFGPVCPGRFKTNYDYC